MTKQEFDKKTNKDLTTPEIMLINPNIYLNPEYADTYYTWYKLERYQDCYDFLMANRNLLKIEKTPKQFMELAKMQLDMYRKNPKMVDMMLGK